MKTRFEQLCELVERWDELEKYYNPVLQAVAVSYTRKIKQELETYRMQKCIVAGEMVKLIKKEKDARTSSCDWD